MMVLMRWIYLQLRSVLSDSMCHDYLFYFLLQGEIIIDEAELTTSWYTPDPDYNYTDVVMEAFKGQRKKTITKNTVWTPEMV